jgi:hypothetical protein
LEHTNGKGGSFQIVLLDLKKESHQQAIIIGEITLKPHCQSEFRPEIESQQQSQKNRKEKLNTNTKLLFIVSWKVIEIPTCHPNPIIELKCAALFKTGNAKKHFTQKLFHYITIPRHGIPKIWDIVLKERS